MRLPNENMIKSNQSASTPQGGDAAKSSQAKVGNITKTKNNNTMTQKTKTEKEKIMKNTIQSAGTPQDSDAAKSNQVKVDQINSALIAILDICQGSTRNRKNLISDITYSVELLDSVNYEGTLDNLIAGFNYLLNTKRSLLNKGKVVELYDNIDQIIRSMFDSEFHMMYLLVNKNRTLIKSKLNLVEVNQWALQNGISINQCQTFYKICKDLGIDIEALPTGFEGGLDVNAFMKNLRQ